MPDQLTIPFKHKRQFRFRSLNINFAKRRENNPVSEEILERFTVKINNQVQRTLFLLAYGKVLSVYDGMVKYKISHLPRRIRDIEEFIGIRPEREYSETTGTASYFLFEEQKIKAIRILKGMN